MVALRFHKVASLPATLEADAFYFVDNGNFAESYLTDSAGSAHNLGNSAMIEAVANPLIMQALAEYNSLRVVADISELDALCQSLQCDALVLVEDASGDPDVASGAALYAYKDATQTWTRIAEYESMDINMTWTNISGRPSSAPATIDDAVNRRHSHTNKNTLDKLGEAGGRLTFDGVEVSADWDTLGW